MGGDFIFGPAELAQGGEKNQVIEGLFRQRETKGPRVGAVFRPSHGYASKLQWRYNGIITIAWRIESCKPLARQRIAADNMRPPRRPGRAPSRDASSFFPAAAGGPATATSTVLRWARGGETKVVNRKM